MGSYGTQTCMNIFIASNPSISSPIPPPYPFCASWPGTGLSYWPAYGPGPGPCLFLTPPIPVFLELTIRNPEQYTRNRSCFSPPKDSRGAEGFYMTNHVSHAFLRKSTL